MNAAGVTTGEACLTIRYNNDKELPIMLERLHSLTDEQKQELGQVASVEEGVAYLKGIGLELTPDELAELSALPDDALDAARGGVIMGTLANVFNIKLVHSQSDVQGSQSNVLRPQSNLQSYN